MLSYDAPLQEERDMWASKAKWQFDHPEQITIYAIFVSKITWR